ncbi:MAG: T9SS type A sorting domain-containing protein [Bacteroidales bacterium]|nr:T9SS type A sorting domain-containing protein [Bacteroidales bacterium]
MKLFLYFLVNLFFCFILNQQVFSQTKRFVLRVQQPPIEQCITSSINDIVICPIKIFPNPSAGLIKVDFGLRRWNSKVLLQLSSVVGEIVFVAEENPDSSGLTAEYNLSRLPKGLYIMNISSKGISLYKKIVLQ